MTAAMKVIWAKPASGILPCTASGTPAARRATAPAVVTAAARTPTETVVRGSVLVNRDGRRSTVVSREAVTVDMVGSFRGRRCCVHRSPCPRTARADSTPKAAYFHLHWNRPRQLLHVRLAL